MTVSPRPPAVAGKFYEASGAGLAHQLEGCFLDARGPGELPVRQRSRDRTLRAAVVPHAGYEYSGPIAAHVYSLVAAQRPPETVLVLGVDHYGEGAGGALSDRAWLTPLGPTAVDHELVRSLAHDPIEIDEDAQTQEHSIEVQLPFLEYVIPRPQFVALQVTFRSFDYLRQVAHVVRDAIKDRDVLLLASTDFSHYLPEKTVERIDLLAIDAILARDARQLYDTVVDQKISMCGVAPTTVMLLALVDERLQVRVLRRGHSGEVQPMHEVVGYAAIALETPPTVPPSVK